MSLEFPNSSRSYDATRCAVRFWGYDTAMEWSFFVTAEALRRVHPRWSTTRSACSARSFPIVDLICAAAA